MMGRRASVVRRPEGERWLALHQNAELYGADRVFLEVTDVLAGRGNVIAGVPSAGPLVAEFDRRGIDYVLIPDLFVLRKSLLRPKALPGALRDFCRSARTLRRLIVAQRITDVYVNTITLPAAVIAGRLSRTRVVVHVHEAETESSPIVGKALVFPLLFSAQIVAISDAVEEFISGNWGRLGDRTYVVRNPVRGPGTPFLPLAQTRPECVVVITPGRWSPRKGIDLAIEACARARASGVVLRLIVVGSVYQGYEWYEEEIRELARQQLPDTEFVPFAADLDDLWRTAEVTMVPSRIEPFGLVAAESLMRGRVTIVTRVGGLPEIVDHGVTGYLSAPTSEALSEQIEAVWNNWPAACEVAERGRSTSAGWTTKSFDIALSRVLEIGLDSS